MSADAHIAADRAAIYRGLKRRNGIVLVLRVVVPLCGALLLGVLGVQLVITNLSKDFTIGHVSIERDRLLVDSPSYSGQLTDGSLYRVGAEKAEASLHAANIIDLTGANVSLTQPNGVELKASAPAAQLDTDKQSIDAPGITSVSDSTGGTGTISTLHLDFPSQVFTADGPLQFAFASGETLKAKTMRYDADAHLWEFTGVTLTLTGTPGETLPEPLGSALQSLSGEMRP